jgi:1-acyl-sn-glycerol-3-phosphate acyltransferase
VLSYLIGRLWLAVFGWRCETPTTPHPKFVIIGAPHTSGWDLPFTLATAWVMRFDVKWMGKQELFAPPFGWFMRALGGIPIDRGAAKNVVAATADQFRKADELVIAVAPEATRHRATHWKSGFYYIAKEAGVPIGCGYLDYSRKVSGVGLYLVPSGNVRADMDRIRAFYKDVKGRFPENQIEPRLSEEPESEAAA